MRITRYAVRHPVYITMLLIALVLFAMLSLSSMNTEFISGMNLPTVIVYAIYPGASAEEVERGVIDVLEDDFATLPDFSSMTSNAYSSVGVVQVQFADGVSKGTVKSGASYQISAVSPREANDIKSLTGVDVEGATHNIQADNVRHIALRHGANGTADRSMANLEDVARARYVLENYDSIELSDEINNMTFYSYEIINRSTFVLTNTFFSQWVDPDLGYAQDDYVGCDVERGLGYCYNGKATDGPGTGAYSGNPPAVGIDFFQGPYMDPDGIDNPKVDVDKFIDVYGSAALEPYKNEDGTVNNILLTDDAYKYKEAWYPKSRDSVNACAINGVNFGNGIVDDERFGMRRFVYYNNDLGNNGEPDKATDYYNYLRGVWKDGSKMCFGGNGYNSGAGLNTAVKTDFMFPGTSDIWGWGTRTDGNEDVGKQEWTEQTAGNSPGDRRFMQSAGPFTLKPGAINYITVGIPFAQAVQGGPMASVELLRQIDDKCQALFDNCFNVMEGPDAPQVVVQELDREIILYLTNESGNNVNESYDMEDVTIPRSYTVTGSNGQDSTVEYDRHYRFEGYHIFQLKDATVSVADIYDESKAQLIAQCDIENYDSTQNNKAIAQLVNYSEVNGLLTPQVMVSGENKGIRHSFRITEDKFSNNTDKRVVNNQKYYYVAIAYAYNNYKEFAPGDATKVDGQKTPYLASRKLGGGGNIDPVVAIPHMVNSEQNGTLLTNLP